MSFQLLRLHLTCETAKRKNMEPVVYTAQFVLDKRRRIDAPLMCGGQPAKENAGAGEFFQYQLRDLQAKAKKALENNQTALLIDLSYQTTRWLGTLPRHHTHYFPSHQAFVNKPAPWSEIFVEGLKVACAHALRDDKLVPRQNEDWSVTLP